MRTRGYLAAARELQEEDAGSQQDWRCGQLGGGDRSMSTSSFGVFGVCAWDFDSPSLGVGNNPANGEEDVQWHMRGTRRCAKPLVES